MMVLYSQTDVSKTKSQHTRYRVGCRRRQESIWSWYGPISLSTSYIPALQTSLDNVSCTLEMVFGDLIVRRFGSATGTSKAIVNLQPFDRWRPIWRILKVFPAFDKSICALALDWLKDRAIHIESIMMIYSEMDGHSRLGKCRPALQTYHDSISMFTTNQRPFCQKRIAIGWSHTIELRTENINRGCQWMREMHT